MAGEEEGVEKGILGDYQLSRDLCDYQQEIKTVSLRIECLVQLRQLTVRIKCHNAN